LSRRKPVGKPEIAKALAVTAEVCGTDLSHEAARAMVHELAAYDPASVANALRRCQREVTGRLSLAAIVQRIDDGHPGAEEAWAICPRDEAQTVVWTDEICEAFGSVLDMVAADDWIGARMAFKDRYSTLVRDSRDAKRTASWSPSLGHSAAGRASALSEAVAQGRLTAEQVAPILPAETEAPALTDGDRSRPPASVAELLSGVRRA